MIKQKIQKIKNMFFDFILFLFHCHQAKQLAKESLLWPLRDSRAKQGVCPICAEGKPRLFFSLPLGWPMPQNDHLLYYDYQNKDMDFLLKNRCFVEKTMGFLLSVPWNFCPHCRNASLGIPFTEEHLKGYYSKYYNRLSASSQKRKNTKERYASYINSLIKKNSQLLELGAAEGYAAKYLAGQGHRVWVIEPAKFKESLFSIENLSLVDNITELKEGSFDCIYLHHVLEHILDIPKFLSAAHRLLKQNGLLVIQVPDISLQMNIYFKSLRWCHFLITNPLRYNKEIISQYFNGNNINSFYWMDALGNNHLYAFTSFGLEYILKTANFQIRLVEQTTKERLVFDSNIFAWPIDKKNGQTPNGVTIVANK